jgi:hypothetical protein
MEQNAMAYPHPSQQPQGGSGLPQQVPNANGMMRGQMPQPMGFPHQQGLQNMGNMPMGPMGGAPQMNNAVGAGMNHPGQGMMNTQMVPQVRIYHSLLPGRILKWFYHLAIHAKLSTVYACLA